LRQPRPAGAGARGSKKSSMSRLEPLLAALYRRLGLPL
jgi:hypothetical protein